MARHAAASSRLSFLWRILRHPLVWISIGAHGLFLIAPMPEIPTTSLEEEAVEEEPEEEVPIDILSFSPQLAEPQVQQAPTEPQSAPRPSSQPPAPTEENLERQQDLDAEALDDETSVDDDAGDDQPDGQDNPGLPFSFSGNCDQVSGNFDITRPPFWPDLVSGELASLTNDQLTLFFTQESVSNGTYQEVDGIDCLKLISRDEATFVNTTLQDNATQANLIVGTPETYGGQTLHRLLQADGVTPASFVTTIPLPPAKVLVLTWNIDPRMR